MEKQEFLNHITAIGSCDDDVQRRELLTQLSEEATKDYDRLSELTASNQSLQNDNETLRSANMKMFLRLGEERNADNDTGIKNEPTKARSFDDLFNAKGELL